MTLRIVADENIPFVHALFASFGDVVTLPGRSMTREALGDADILLVRSVTNVGKELIDSASIQFVGTCTIGVDHLDTNYLNERNIPYASAPGCNANAVVQYVLGVLAKLNGFDTAKKVLIVGGGNVGGRVYDALTILGFDCSIVDPFLDGCCGRKLTEFSSLSSADIISFHAPLTVDGPYPTHHMLDEKLLMQVKVGAVLINAGRGGVIDNTALLKVLRQRSDLQVVLDVWEHEPDINTDLLQLITLGTPHIAGYSFEGRLNGSLMIYDALVAHLKLDVKWVAEVRKKVCEQALGCSIKTPAKSILEAVISSYNVCIDDVALRSVANELPEAFDALRKNYPQRREYSHYRYDELPECSRPLFLSLGFDVRS